jgi:hypothetical protein
MKIFPRIAVIGLIVPSLLVSILPSTGFAAPRVNRAASGSLPQGKPFQYLNSRIDALQAQINHLIGRVDSLEAWEGEAKIVLTQLQANTAANAAAIALLTGEIENIQTILATKQDIISSQCPAGQYVSSISQSTVICRVDSVQPAVYTVFTYKNIASKTTDIITAACPPASAVTGGSHQSVNLQINGEGIDPLNNGWSVNATNLTTGSLPLISIATCIG